MSFITNTHIKVKKQFKIYLDCSPQEQLVLRVLAICYEPIGQHVFRKILATFVKIPELGLQCSTDKIDKIFSPVFRDFLDNVGLITVNAKGVMLSRHLCHVLTMQTIQDGSLSKIIEQIESVIPARTVSHYGQESSHYLLRERHNLLYQGDFAKLEKTLSFKKDPQQIEININEYLLDFCFSPFTEKFFLNLPEQVQYQAFAVLLSKQHLALEDTTETLALLFDLNARQLCSQHLQLLLAEQLLLNGDSDNAKRILLPMHNEFSEKANSKIHAYLLALLGWLAFLQGDFKQAISHFEQHKIAKNKVARRKRQYVCGVAGLFYSFALLKQGYEENTQYLTKALEQHQHYMADNTNPEHESSTYRTLSSCLNVFIKGKGSMTKLYTERSFTNNEFDGKLNLLISAICHIWLGKKPSDDYLNALHQHFSLWRQSNQLWFAQLCADILVNYGTGSLHLDENAKLFYQDFLINQPSNVDMLTLIKQKELWLDALDKLISLDKSHNLATEEPTLIIKQQSRMIWLVNTHGEHDISPREQKKNKNGWSKGRAVSLDRLKNNTDDFTFLTPVDIKICQEIEAYYEGYSWHQREFYELSGYRALKACVGHPLLFVDNEHRTPLDIVENVPELVISESGDGYKIMMENIPPYADFSQSFYNFISETATRYILINFQNMHLDIAQIVGHKGLKIPKSAKEKVIASIKAIAPLLNIQTNIDGIEGIDTGIEQVDCDPTLYINIEPIGEGLQLECHIQPLGEQGPNLLPGVGNAMVVGQVDGIRIGTTRLLAQEKKHFSSLVDACPMFNYMADHLLVLDDIEDALTCLEQLEVLAQTLKEQNESNENSDKHSLKVSLQWPQGKAIKVSKALSSEQMKVNITKKQNWFDLDGELSIDDEQVIDMKKLIDLVGNAKGRFIQLSDDHFIALTEGLKKQLTLLDKVSQNGQFDALASPVIDEALSGMVVKLSTAWQEQLTKLTQSYKLQPKVPSTLQAQLRDYQLEGFDWASRLSYWGAGACLADDMGLGKTLQALAVIVDRASKGPTLVLAPTSVSFNWQEEANKFSPTLNVKLYGMHSQENRQKILDNATAFDLIICSYGLLQTQGEKLSKVHWQTLIADEAQALKNPQTKRSKIANTLSADFKMITTGTPIENNLTELWSLFRFINPNLLGSLKQFTERFVKPIESASFVAKKKDTPEEKQQQKNEANEALRKIIAPFMLRRLKTDVLTELPSRTEINIHVELSKEEAALYEAIRQKALENLTEGNDKPGQKRIKVLAEIMRLRRACCHPKLVFEESDISGAKLQAFDHLVDELKQGDHKALVFSQFVGHLQLLKQHLEEKGISFQYLDGSTPLAKRKKAVTDFQAGQGDLFLISLKAGGSGLNLTAADYVIHMDPWWNPAVEDQASDRAHRMGQTRPVTIYRLITQNTIEDKIVALHQQKRDLANSLLEGTGSAKAISLDDMLNLLKD